MKNSKSISAQYDVKNEIGSEIMRWMQHICDIRDNIGDDWEHLDALQKMSLYWFIGNVCASKEVRYFECDTSDYANNYLDAFPVRRETEYLADCSDTLTSAWSPLKKYLGLTIGKMTTCDLFLSGTDTFAKECREKLLGSGAMDFIEANHTIGNFLPVPAGFNCARTGYTGAPDYLAANDQADLCLMAIRKYYKLHAERNDITTLDTEPLRELFCSVRKDEDIKAISNTKAWLDHFGCWSNFVEKNMLAPMVDDNGDPIAFFPGHSLEKPYPDNEEDWKTFFKTSTELIRMRSEYIIKWFEGRQ